MNKIYLFPGKIYATQEPSEITTILGSCVAIALFDPVAKVAGLNHYLLPQVKNDDSQIPRYGIFAIPQLIRELETLWGTKSRFQARIFGGGSVLGEVSQDIEVGAKNIEIAKKILGQNQIPII